MLSAALLSAGWAGATAAALYFSAPLLMLAALSLDTLRLVAWCALLLSLLAPPPEQPTSPKPTPWLPHWINVAIAVAACANIVLMGFPGPVQYWLGYGSQIPFAAPLSIAIIGLILVEQILRHIPAAGRWSLKPLALGLGGLFSFDLYLFAEAFLFKGIDPEAWSIRGIANLVTIPLLLMAANRSQTWNIRISVSRHIIFHSTALLVSGLYLLAVAGAGYYLRFFGGTWGGALQTVLLFSSLLLLIVVVFSESFRSKLRVLIAKHFFRYRYDYRKEWLHFTQSLSSPSAEDRGLPEVVIQSLANLVESPAGALWLVEENQSMRQHASINMPAIPDPEPAHSTLLAFLARTQWIVDLDTVKTKPEDYDFLELPTWLAQLPDAWLVLPLFFEQKLFGFVILAHARAKVEINWEVLDLLKTAASQAASYLSHMRAADILLEAKKFDAFNRMSAFVVHDIKNLVAQLSLLLKNAERHKDNPEFQEDMFMTIAHVVDRMKHLLLQLRAGTTPVDRPRPIYLPKILEKTSRIKQGAPQTFTLSIEQELSVLGHEERLERVIGHLFQNALDATPADGKVWIRLFRQNEHAVIEVGDTGCGMSEDFVHNHLFRPFDSTKSAGMGIGAYESAQYITELGGSLDVDSQIGQGTLIRIRLPVHQKTATALETE